MIFNALLLSLLMAVPTLALPQKKSESTDPKYCYCTRPLDGRQDPDVTASVCPAQKGTYGMIPFSGGGSFGACENIGLAELVAFGTACVQAYGHVVPGNGNEGGTCCEPPDYASTCKDYPPYKKPPKGTI